MSTERQKRASIGGTHLPGGPFLDEEEIATLGGTHIPFTSGNPPMVVGNANGNIAWQTKTGIYIPQ